MSGEASQRESVCHYQWKTDWALSSVSEVLFRSQESAAWKPMYSVSWRWNRNCATVFPSSTNTKSDISKNSSVLGSAPFVTQGEILTLPEGSVAHPQSGTAWELHSVLRAVTGEMGCTCIWLLPYAECPWETCSTSTKFFNQKALWFCCCCCLFFFSFATWKAQGCGRNNWKSVEEDFCNFSRLMVA